MVEAVRIFVVDPPVDAVVGYLKDLSRSEEWEPGTRSCRRVDGGSVSEGSRWHTVSTFRGRAVEMGCTLTRLEPNRLTFVGSNRTATATIDIRVQQEAGATSISLGAEIQSHGWLKLATPLMHSELKAVSDKMQSSLTHIFDDMDPAVRQT